MRRPRSPLPTRLVLLAALAVLSLALPLAGCPGTLDDPARFCGQFGGGGGGGGGAACDSDAGSDGGTCPDIPTFLATTCTGAGCHNTASPIEGLDLQSPGLFARLSGKMAMEGPGLLIDPTTPAKSIIYLKLMAPPPFGSRMPLTGMPLSDAQMACVLSWITNPN